MTKSKKIVFTKDAVPPLPFFSQATIAKGVVYCSGNIGCTNDYVLVEGGIKAQTRRALENLSIILKAAGSGLEHIVKVNVYLMNMNDFQAMSEVYAEFFDDKENMPARTCIAVAGLPVGASFEIECTAVVPDA